MKILRVIFFIICFNIMLSLFQVSGVVGSGYNNDEFGETEYNLTASGNFTPTYHTDDYLWRTGKNTMDSICDSSSGSCTINFLDPNLWFAVGGLVIGVIILVIKSIFFMYLTLQDIGIDTDVALMISAPYYILLVIAMIQIFLNRNLADMW